MPCSCSKNKTKFEVVVGGKVVYSAAAKPLADSVAKKYPDSTVREVKPAAKTAKAPAKTPPK